MIKIESGKYEVCMWREAGSNRGSFERITDGAGGGLWFEGNELVDYDGMMCLPQDVIKALRSLNYKVDKDFE